MLLNRALRLLNPVVVLEFLQEVKAQHLKLDDALSEALQLWTENRRYLRAGDGERRFPLISQLMRQQIEQRHQEVMQQTLRDQG